MYGSEGINKERDIQNTSNGDDYYIAEWFVKDAPPTSSWMSFSEKGEYDHMEFIDRVDRLKTEFYMKDSLVTSKLNIVLTGLSRIWLLELRREGALTWKVGEIHDPYIWDWDWEKQPAKSVWQRQVQNNSKDRTSSMAVETKKKNGNS